MGPIVSKVIEYRGQRSNLWGFFLFPPRSLGRSSPNLAGRWRAAPDISLRGSFFERSRSSRSKVKFMFFLFVPLLLPGPSFFERSRSSRSKVKFMGFFSVCSPTSPRSLDRSSRNLVGRLRAAPDISSRGSFLKVKVIEVKGEISVSRQSLVRFA